jgi:hypothetical protein
MTRSKSETNHTANRRGRSAHLAESMKTDDLCPDPIQGRST